MTKKISAMTNMNGNASIDRAADFVEITDSSGPTTYKATPNFILGFTGGNPMSTSDTQSVTNKTLDNTNIITVRDDRFTMQDSGDVTKQAQFQLSGITTGQTRVYTLPNATDTLVGRATTDTLTNKTISGGTLSGVTIDNPVLQTDTVSEHTSTNGVTVDGLNIKDGKLNTASSVVATNITDGDVQPKKLVSGLGTTWAWQTWTPTWTNVTVGNGVVSAQYTQVGKLVTATIAITLGSTSSVTGAIIWSLPVTAAARYTGSTAGRYLMGQAYLEDAGTLGYLAFIEAKSTTTATLDIPGTSSTYATGGGSSGSVPFAWGSSDFFAGTFTYEAA